jgi:hypothetical protein
MVSIKKKMGLTGAGAALALLALSGPAGAAATSAPAAPHAHKIQAAMVVTGVDAAVAKAHGYRVVKINGRSYTEKIGSAAPDNVVSGNCGSSYMWLYSDGSSYTTAVTGFNVTAAAISYSWQIIVVDNAGTAHHSFGGSLAFDSSWSGSWRSWHSVKGYSWAEVVSGYALLWDGEICSSLYPWDWTNVY